MPLMTRLIGVSVLLAITGLGAAVLRQTTGEAGPADLVLLNGRIYTLDEARPWAEALAVRRGRIAAVGSTAEIKPLAGPQTTTLDLAGAFATAGFNDAHVHIESTGALLTGANLLDVHEPKAFRQRIAEAAKRLPAGSWIQRGDWGAYEQWNQGSAGAAAGSTAAPARSCPTGS